MLLTQGRGVKNYGPSGVILYVVHPKVYILHLLVIEYMVIKFTDNMSTA